MQAHTYTCIGGLEKMTSPAGMVQCFGQAANYMLYGWKVFPNPVFNEKWRQPQSKSIHNWVSS